MCLSGMIKHAMNKEKRKNIIETHPYKIWLASDNNWKTYVYDETKKNHRRLIKKVKLETLHDEIIQEYIKREKEKCEKDITFRDIYPQWLRYKELHVKQSSYMARIIADWNRFYEEDSSIIDIPLKNLNDIVLDTWLHAQIKKYNMTKTCFYNMSLIIRQGLLYCVARGFISDNPMEKVKINTNLFRKVKKADPELQVFSYEEEIKISQYAIDDFKETKHPACLAVLLNFQVGLRIGELAALKFSDFDISKQLLSICRMEVKDFEIIIPDHGKVQKHLKERIIVPFTKTSAGIRKIILTKKAINIFSALVDLNHDRNFSTNEYLFINDSGKRITTCSIDHKIVRYCRNIGIPEKRIHKIRKTYISTLLDEKVNLDLVRRMVGHEDERTTLHNYYFDRRTKKENIDLIEHALSLNNTPSKLI